MKSSSDQYMRNIFLKSDNGAFILYVPYLNCFEISKVCFMPLGESNIILFYRGDKKVLLISSSLIQIQLTTLTVFHYYILESRFSRS